MFNMINLSKFIDSQSGKIVASVILGLGLATLFRRACNGKNCILYKAAPLDEVIGKIFRYNGKCYKFNPTQAKCDTSKQILEFA